MRVLHIIATLDRSGAEKQLARSALGLRRAGHEVGVCCLTRGGVFEDELRAAAVPVTVLGKRGRFDLTVIGRLCRVIRGFRPEIVHTWMFSSNLVGRIAAIICRVPVIIGSERAADVWKGRLHRLADRFLARRTAAVMANAEGLRDFCVDFLGLPSEKIEVIYNGLDLAEFDARAAAGVSAPTPQQRGAVIGVVGRLDEQKGHPWLLRAMALLDRDETDLWVVGHGPAEGRLRAEAADLGLANVHFLGQRDDVPALLRQMDILALPSLWEGMPNAVMEAMAASLPVVATAVHGTPELVDDGVTGILAPARNVSALCAALRRLLDDGDLRRRMGEAGRRRIAERFSEEKMTASTIELYERLLRSAADRNGRRERRRERGR